MTDIETDAAGTGPAPTALAVLDHIARSVVAKPDDVSIEVESDEDGVSFIVHVADGDVGRIVGRRGKLAGAIRTLVRAAAVRDGVAVDVDFAD